MGALDICRAGVADFAQEAADALAVEALTLLVEHAQHRVRDPVNLGCEVIGDLSRSHGVERIVPLALALVLQQIVVLDHVLADDAQPEVVRRQLRAELLRGKGLSLLQVGLPGVDATVLLLHDRVVLGIIAVQTVFSVLAVVVALVLADSLQATYSVVTLDGGSL